MEKTRRIPQQRRAQTTVDVVLEAAAQLLERDGWAAFNTNAVAARAGVSIGSLYRYFRDKHAIVAALAEREIAAHRAHTTAILEAEGRRLAPDRALIRAFVRAFAGRRRARQVVMSAWFSTAEPSQVATGFNEVEGSLVDQDGTPLSPIAAFVLSRAVHGALRAAVLEGAEFLESQEFEDELVRLNRAYLRAVQAAKR